MPLCTPKRIQCLAFLLAAGTILTVLVILFFHSYPRFARQQIVKAVTFANGSQSMTRFETTEDLKNLRLSFHVYNITNSKQFMDGTDKKLKVQEVGPFVYSEFKVRDFINNNQTSGLITYKLRRRYILDLQLSVSDPRVTKVIWPNVPLIVARDQLDRLGFVEKQIAYFAFELGIAKLNETAFITDTVQNFIYDGSKRDLFEYLQSLDKLHFVKPWPLEDNKFALLYKRNFTFNPMRDHILTTSAGVGEAGYETLNNYVYVDNSSTLNNWYVQPPNCNKVGGTDGEFFAPFRDTSSPIEIYPIDVCRRLALKYNQTTTLKGISCYQYNLDPETLQSGLKNPSNQCYCLARGNGVPKAECNLDGLIDLATCAFPNIVASGAHFLAGSKELTDRIDGLGPVDLDLHNPNVYVEPNTGITLKVKVPIQFNTRLESGSGFSIFKNFTDPEPLIIPLLWVAESSEMTDEQANMMRAKLLILDSWFVSMVLGGAIITLLAVIVLVLTLCAKYRHRSLSVSEAVESDPLLPDTSQQGRSYASTAED